MSGVKVRRLFHFAHYPMQFASTACGARTRLSGLRIRYPDHLDQRGMKCVARDSNPETVGVEARCAVHCANDAGVPPQGLEPCSSRIKSPVPVHPGVSGAEKARVELARRLPPLIRFRDGCRRQSACFSKAEGQGFEPCRDVTAAYAISNGAPRPDRTPSLSAAPRS